MEGFKLFFLNQMVSKQKKIGKVIACIITGLFGSVVIVVF
jgi:hypothetical protein